MVALILFWGMMMVVADVVVSAVVEGHIVSPSSGMLTCWMRCCFLFHLAWFGV
jgi:hypothetical protein